MDSSVLESGWSFGSYGEHQAWEWARSRSYLVPRRRGGAKRKPDRAQPQEKFGEMVRPEDSAGLTTPAAPFKGGFAIFSLMSRPPLLFKEGNLASSSESAP